MRRPPDCSVVIPKGRVESRSNRAEAPPLWDDERRRVAPDGALSGRRRTTRLTSPCRVIGAGLGDHLVFRSVVIGRCVPGDECPLSGKGNRDHPLLPDRPASRGVDSPGACTPPCGIPSRAPVPAFELGDFRAQSFEIDVGEPLVEQWLRGLLAEQTRGGAHESVECCGRARDRLARLALRPDRRSEAGSESRPTPGRTWGPETRRRVVPVRAKTATRRLSAARAATPPRGEDDESADQPPVVRFIATPSIVHLAPWAPSLPEIRVESRSNLAPQPLHLGTVSGDVGAPDFVGVRAQTDHSDLRPTSAEGRERLRDRRVFGGRRRRARHSAR